MAIKQRQVKPNDMAALVKNKNGIWCLEGELLMQNVPGLFQHAVQLITRAGQLRLDLSAVTRYDSSIFSFLLSLYREAEKRTAELYVYALPNGFLSQAEIYGCRELMRQICQTAYPPRLVSPSGEAKTSL